MKSRQESPPAWTQEAYRPPRSKHMLCLLTGGRGVPPSSPNRGGVPHPVLTGGSPPSSPDGGGEYPHTVSMWGGVPPPVDQVEYPHWQDGVTPSPCRPDGCTPHQPDRCTPHQPDGGTPLSAGWGYLPPPPEMWKERHLWKQYLLHSLGMRAVMIRSNFTVILLLHTKRFHHWIDPKNMPWRNR